MTTVTTVTTATVDPEVLLARAYLNRVAEPGCVPLWADVEERGPVAVAADVRAGRGSPDVIAATEARAGQCDPEADLEAAARHGIGLVVPESQDWPHFAMGAFAGPAARRVAAWRAGNHVVDRGGEPIPPLALWVRGNGAPAELASLGIRSVGIVGARSSTDYGNRIAEEFAAGLARRGFVVVSGGAYGIDAAAHRGALAVGGVTVIVAAGGLDRAYPPSHDRLFERVAEAGLLLSESPPGAAPQRRRFLTRNRIIAALSTGTVVVEAAARSGARNTARHAGVLGRVVAAVPGPITSAMSVGCHQMLVGNPADGVDPAELVTSLDDLLALIGGVGDSSAGDGAGRPQPSWADPRDDLDPVARQVLDGFPARRPARIEELALTTGIAPLAVLRALPELERTGLVEPIDGSYRIRAAARRSAKPDPDALRAQPTLQ